MATVSRHRRVDSFDIHEDVPSTEDTEMNEEIQEEDGGMEQDDDVEDQESIFSDSSEDEPVDGQVQDDMDKLQDCFPRFREKYKLIKRIGEGLPSTGLPFSRSQLTSGFLGTFSTVYKAEDLQYDHFDNDWDLDKENEKWTPPPIKRFRDATSSGTMSMTSLQTQQRRRKPKYVAIKKIYVTSSPSRILNELELLHDLRSCPSVCPLITAFRHTDQVVAILPYFRHADFREYFRKMTATDMAIYMRALFTALSAVHAHGIIHRDIKPTNFLYDPATQRGVLVDFGLAEREGVDSKPCVCHDDPTARKNRLRAAFNASSAPHNGYPKSDTRPSRRANRAGTRGFRAPEVLFKCTEQTTKIDVWSVGVVLLTILSRRFPFFNSADDVEAMVEIATIFGTKRMRAAGQLHGCMFETSIPTIGQTGFSLEKIIMWSTCRSDTDEPLSGEEKLALEFLNRCLELDPARRISADEALEHSFLQLGLDVAPEAGEDDDLDMVKE